MRGLSHFAAALSQSACNSETFTLMSFDTRSDEELLAAVPTDGSAFAALYGRYFRQVTGYFINRTRNAEVSADLSAETFAALLEGAARYDPALGAAKSWLFGIAHRKLVDSLRQGQVDARARRRLGMTRLELTDADIERLEEYTQDVDVLGLLADLPADQRMAIAGHVIREEDYSELARDLRCSEAVVRQRVSRGLRTLRQLLEGSV